MIEAYGKDPAGDRVILLSATKLYRKFFDLLYTERDVEGARRVADQLLMHYPGSWFGHDTMGHCHSSAGDIAAAVASAAAALAMDPQNWALLGRLGQLYEELGDLDQAEKHLRAAAARPEGKTAQAWIDAFLERHQATA